MDPYQSGLASPVQEVLWPQTGSGWTTVTHPSIMVAQYETRQHHRCYHSNGWKLPECQQTEPAPRLHRVHSAIKRVRSRPGQQTWQNLFRTQSAAAQILVLRLETVGRYHQPATDPSLITAEPNPKTCDSGPNHPPSHWTVWSMTQLPSTNHSGSLSPDLLPCAAINSNDSLKTSRQEYFSAGSGFYGISRNQWP